jgi:hypothetical protein
MTKLRISVVVGILLVWAIGPFQSSFAQAPATGIVALTGARVIDGTGAAPLEGATIVLADGRIQAVGTGVAIASTCPARRSCRGSSMPTAT